MPKGRTDHAKIGSGEYQYPGTSGGELRQLFLAVVSRDVPQVMAALAAIDQDNVTGRVSEAALAEWAATWGFCDDEWLLGVARRTLELWHGDPSARKFFLWADAIQVGEFVPEPQPIRWRPTIETEAQFRLRVEAYIGAVRGWARRLGLQETPAKPNLHRDVAALVQFHVKGDDLAAVSDEWFGSDAHVDAARKAIDALAKAMELTVRRRRRK